jgi:hypothetical protein
VREAYASVRRGVGEQRPVAAGGVMQGEGSFGQLRNERHGAEAISRYGLLCTEANAAVVIVGGNPIACDGRCGSRGITYMSRQGRRRGKWKQYGRSQFQGQGAGLKDWSKGGNRTGWRTGAGQEM